MRWGILFFLISLNLFPFQSNDLFEKSLTIGRGQVRHIEWHPKEDIILVDTVRGAWLYNSAFEDIAFIEDLRLGTFMPDGNMIAGADSQNRIGLWDSTTFELHTLLGEHAGFVTAISRNSTGNYVASADRSGAVKVWDINGEQLYQEFQINEPVYHLRWNPAGDKLAVISACTAVQVWDINEGKSIFDTPVHEYCDDSIGVDEYYFAWIDDESFIRRYLVISRANFEQEVWNIRTKQIAVTSDVLFVDIRFTPSMRFMQTISPDRKWVACSGSFSAAGSPSIYVTPLDDYSYASCEGEGGWQFPRYTQAIHKMAWNGDGTKLAIVGTFGGIYIWNPENPYGVVESVKHAQALPIQPYQLDRWNTHLKSSPTWSPDSQLIAIPDTAGNVQLLDASSGELRQEFRGHEYLIWEIAWHPDGNHIATTTSPYHGFFPENAYARIWAVESGEVWQQFTDKNGGWTVTWTPDGRFLYSSASDHTMRVWNYESRIWTHAIDISRYPTVGYIQRVREMNWSLDGSKFIIIGEGSVAPDTTSFEWDSFIPLGSFNRTHSPLYIASAWTPDGKLWRRAAWYEKRYLDYYCCNPRENLAPDPYVIEISVLYGEPAEKKTLSGHTLILTNVVWSPDGRHLISTSEDGTTRLWDVDTECTLYTFEYFTRIVWSPDGQMFAGLDVASYEWKIYDSRTGALLQTLPENYPESAQLFWSPDGQQIARTHEGVTNLWRMDSENQ